MIKSKASSRKGWSPLSGAIQPSMRQIVLLRIGLYYKNIYGWVELKLRCSISEKYQTQEIEYENRHSINESCYGVLFVCNNLENLVYGPRGYSRLIYCYFCGIAVAYSLCIGQPLFGMSLCKTNYGKKCDHYNNRNPHGIQE